MSPAYIGFTVGIFVGVFLGIIIIGLLSMARESKKWRKL